MNIYIIYSKIYILCILRALFACYHGKSSVYIGVYPMYTRYTFCHSTPAFVSVKLVGISSVEALNVR
jgi:hypothetical protein